MMQPTPPLQSWPQSQGPRKRKGPRKWVLLAAAAFIVVTAITMTVALHVLGRSADSSAPPSAGSSEIVSLDDEGPAGIITADATCASWGPVAKAVSDVEKNGWNTLDHTIPASAWTPDMEAKYRAVGAALKTAARQTNPLTNATTHRVMRDLYLHFRKFSLAYAAHIPEYTRVDDWLIRAGSGLGDVITAICHAASFGPAAARAPSVPEAKAPQPVVPADEKQIPDRILSIPDAQCADWSDTVDAMNADPTYSAWNRADSTIAASSRTLERKAADDAVAPILSRYADVYEKLAWQSSNSSVQDFGILAAQYGRAFVNAIPTYTQPDTNLYDVFRKLPAAIVAACKAPYLR
ncbi:Uncharacterised protein [Mycobacteroides abscessus subsp. abscessus]|nr:Uncharacterised protein [Mycobacteroides abscessus subsp. abscessus]